MEIEVDMYRSSFAIALYAIVGAMPPKRTVQDDPTPESFLPLPRDTFHILVSLADRERHGYSVMLDVAERTDGALRLSPSSLYASIKRLLTQESDRGAGRAAGSQARRRAAAVLPADEAWAAASRWPKRGGWNVCCRTPARPGSCPARAEPLARRHSPAGTGALGRFARCWRCIRASSATSTAASWPWCSPIAIAMRPDPCERALVVARSHHRRSQGSAEGAPLHDSPGPSLRLPRAPARMPGLRRRPPC